MKPIVNSNLDSYLCEKDRIRENLNKYTIKSFRLLPNITNPKILDVGCGTGVPTIKLAEISGGDIKGLDNDTKSLDILQRKIKSRGFDKKVHIINESIFTMDFPEESFDIIWAEGSVFVMGFENSINKWRSFLKPEGFIIIHYDNKEKNKKLKSIKKYGYRLINQFELSHQIWWEEYYSPLEQLIKEFKHKYPDDSELINELNKDQKEIYESFQAANASSLIIIIQKL
ncbi:MAG: class I SAM-dependent methyltransferase [Methanobacterium sp.]|nr:class I SAM-dependent methyltransferase [Methanobacterium sp.]